jgi:hypothetical protein
MISNLLAISVIRLLVGQEAKFEDLALKLYRNGTPQLVRELHSIPKEKLRRISDSFRVDVVKDPERLAAMASALAFAKVDVSKNLNRMRSVYLAFDLARRSDKSSRKKLMDVTEYLSGAYYDVWSVTRCPLAVKYLWEMRLDGGLAEMQAGSAVRCFESAPNSFLRAIVFDDDFRTLGFADELADRARTDPPGFDRLLKVLQISSKRAGVVGTNARRVLRRLSART